MKERKSFKRNLKVIFGTITLLLILSQTLSIIEIMGLGSVTGNIISQLVILVINVTAVWAGYTVLSKKLLAPLIEMDGAAMELAAGNLNIDINHESKDEVGYLADSFRGLIAGENLIINDMTHIIRQFNEGNFDQRTSCEAEYKGSFAIILDELRALAISFSTTMAGIDEAAEQVSALVDSPEFQTLEAEQQGKLLAHVYRLHHTMEQIKTTLRLKREELREKPCWHYTRMSTMQKLLLEQGEQPPRFRLSNVAYMNDSAEGESFGKLLEQHGSTPETLQAYGLLPGGEAPNDSFVLRTTISICGPSTLTRVPGAA